MRTFHDFKDKAAAERRYRYSHQTQGGGMRRRYGIAAALVLQIFALVAAPPAGADTYPSRPVRIIVPFPPGGGVDISNRIVTSRLPDILGQQIVIENRSGASGNL